MFWIKEWNCYGILFPTKGNQRMLWLPLFLPELFQTKAAQNNETELNLGRAHSLYTFMSIQLLKAYTFHWLVVGNMAGL